MSTYASFNYYNPSSKISRFKISMIRMLYLFYTSTLLYLHNIVNIRQIIKWAKQLKYIDTKILIQNCLLIAMDILNFSIIGTMLFFVTKIT